MYSLEMYEKLSNEDNQYLEHYLVYRDIYNMAKEKGVVISADDVVDLREIIVAYFDDVDNFRLSEITEFIAGNVLDDNITMEQIKQCSNYDIYEAIENDDIDYLCEMYPKKDERER